MKKILLFIKKIFYKIGIDIKFVKRGDENILHSNTLHEFDEFFSDPKIKNTYLEKARLEFYKWLVKLMKENNISLNDKSVADIGCGLGKLFEYIDKEFQPKSYHGFDYSEKALEIAKTIFPKAEYQFYDIYKPLNQTFDFIICTEVLEHLLYPHTALQNMYKMMNDNAIIFLTVPDGRMDTFKGHFNFWSIQSWEVFLNLYFENFEIITGLENNILYGIIKKK